MARTLYFKRRIQKLANRKARYALQAPRDSLKCQFSRSLYKTMLSNADCRVQLRSTLQTVKEAAADKISTTTVENVTCKVAAEWLICKALKVWRDSVGQLLKCVRYVN